MDRVTSAALPAGRRALIVGARCLAGWALLVGRPAFADEPVAARVSALASDGSWIEPSQDHLAITRQIPRAFTKHEPGGDDDEVRLVFAGLGVKPDPGALRIATLRVDDRVLDTLPSPALSPSACPPRSPAGPCWATLTLRLTPDHLDREYPEARERSLEAELGGEVRVEVAGRFLAGWRVGGPRGAAFAGFDRLSVKLRVRILRVTPGGVPAIGGDSALARKIARDEIEAASKLWAQCGIDLQGPTGPDVEVVDPPRAELLAFGCDAGLPASGGQITFDVAGHRIRIPSHAGEAPLVVAQRVARALRGFGLRAELSPNPRTSSGASGAVDVLVRSAQGSGVEISSALNSGLSTDATLSVCLGEVDLGNGLSHFAESDAASGTVEERALIKAFDDGDPTTIDVFIVPSFDQSGRIGESFIDGDGAAIQNTVIIDRAAVRAGPRSYALAHEIGHVLLDMPGHPDDYGVDQSSSLMDADAADASVFGPRRLSITDCERALRQSGPAANTPLLRPWPISPKREPAPVTSGR
jgi:hypothetical protein